MKHSITALIGLGGLSLCLSGKVMAQAYTENFDDITTLTASGWFTQNNSSPLGTTGWFQGNNGVFAAYNGAATAYIGANFNNTTGSTGVISNWLITPNRTLRNGDVFTFYSRKGAPDTYPDRLEVRLSTNGASTNVGTLATDVGDFSTLLLSINPTQVTGVYPVVWTQYTVTISGLPAPTSGRIAFRYFVTSAGPTGVNSDYIGIDNVVYTPYVCPTMTVTPGSLPNGTAGVSYSQTLGQTGALGTPSYSVTGGSLPPGLTLSSGGTISGTPTATGTYNFMVTVSDASGCTGAMMYSITINCPTGGAGLSTLPTLCSNAGLYTLTQGSPSGGTYSGTGVSGGQFDPTAGTQIITYTVTDTYSCLQTATGTITVNTAPTVSLSPFTAVCDNGGMVSLSGGSPAGGTYSGTGVSGGQFDPASGTQTITYSYTDGNGCSNNDSEVLTVNTAPTVTLATQSAACDNGGLVTLSGGSPAGGTYSGTGVSGGQFDPASGTQTITYSYTDGNGCSNSDSDVLTVNTAPTVTLGTVTDLCSNGGMHTLAEGSPAGGTYSGTGVSGGQFDLSVGTQDIVYTYTDGNGCTNSDTNTYNVTDVPTVTLTPFNAICNNAGMVTLSGGSPAGGTYSGTGVSGGQFDPASGTQTITYTYTVGLCSANDTEVLTVIDCSGIEETDGYALSYYPNPGDGILNLSFTAPTSGDYQVQVLGLDGKQLYQRNYTLDQGTALIGLDLRGTAAGTYLLVLTGKEGSVYRKFIIR